VVLRWQVRLWSRRVIAAGQSTGYKIDAPPIDNAVSSVVCRTYRVSKKRTSPILEIAWFIENCYPKHPGIQQHGSVLSMESPTASSSRAI